MVIFEYFFALKLFGCRKIARHELCNTEQNIGFYKE